MKLLKEITTSEPISAKVKFKKDFTLRTVRKLAVGTNHRLTLKNTGMDVKRRIRMIPFDWTVPEDEIVPDLEKKLMEEAPEILRLLIYFAVRYYSTRYKKNFSPKASLDEYRMKELWGPQKRQAQALANNSFELLYGGAAGGGKSDFLLADYISFANEWREDWKGPSFRW